MATQAIMHPVDYASRDYTSLREDLINVIRTRIPEWLADDPADFGVALVEAFAYMGDIFNYYIDRSAAETFLGTASQRGSLLNIASLLGYSPTGRLAARVTLTFTNNSQQLFKIPSGARVTTTIRASDLNALLTYEVGYNPDTNDGSWEIHPGGQSLLIPAVEGVTVKDQLLGQSNGYAGQKFVIRDTPMINRSLEILVGPSAEEAVPYTYVQNLFEATPNDDRFSYRTDDAGITTVTFGDGISGTVPPNFQNIYATFRIGGGTEGNIAPGHTFIPDGWTFPGSIVNQTKGFGGAMEEGDEQIREAAFTAFRTRNSAVTKQDFQDLAAVDNRISKSKARGNSLGNITVFVAPNSSGDQTTDPHPGSEAYNVVSRSLQSGVVTLTLEEAPQFEDREVTVSGMGEPWDGTYLATSGENNTISYPKVSNNRPTETSSGVVNAGELETFTQTREEVRQNLQRRGVMGSIIRVEPYRFRDVRLSVEVGIRQVFRQSAGLSATRAALQRLLSYNSTPLNLSLRAQDIHAYLTNNVPEIWYATVELYDGPDSETPISVVVAKADEVIRLLDSALTVTPSPADPGIVNT